MPMPCAKRAGGRHSRVQRLERAAMKNGFKPGVYEERGLYVGQWVDDAKQGKGKKLYKNKTVYEGDWMANQKHGFGVLMKKFNGHFVFIFEGQWINNRFVKGKWYGNNGIYDGSFSTTSGITRMKCGYGTMRWNDGAVYRGNWRNNVYEGRGRLVEANGNYYDGQWSRGLKHGEGTYVFFDKGLIMDGIWIDGFPKVSEIKHFDVDREFVALKHQRLIPKISKSDEKDIGAAYESARTETLKILQNSS